MTIERNDTPSWEEKQVQTMSGSEKELVLESEELANIDREKGKDIGEELAEKGLEELELRNSIIEALGVDPGIVDNSLAYAEQYVKERNEAHRA